MTIIPRGKKATGSKSRSMQRRKSTGMAPKVGTAKPKIGKAPSKPNLRGRTPSSKISGIRKALARRQLSRR